MSKLIKRVIACMVIVALIVGSFLNYVRVRKENDSITTNVDTQIKSDDKVYAEENVSLPDFDKDDEESILGMNCNPEGSCEIYTVKNRGKIYSRYTQTAKGDWTTSEIKWSDFFGEGNEKYPSYFRYSSKGELYCIAVPSASGNKTQECLAKIAKDGTVQKIKIPTLSMKEDEGDYRYVTSYIITDNGYFIFTDRGNWIYAIDIKTGEVKYIISDYCVLNMAVGTDDFYFVDYSTGKIEELDINTGKEVNRYSLPFQEECDEQDYMDTNLMIANNSLYVISSDGIYQHTKDGFKCLVEGYANRLSQPSKNYNPYYSMDRNGDCYNIGYDLKGDVSLTKYTGKTGNMKQYQEEFTVAMYYNDARVLEAIAQLSKSHPDINVKCVYLDRNADMETQKKQCEKADAIVCDNTLYTNLKSDHILKDISTTAQALIQSEGLYANIINDFYEGSSLYVMPADFKANIYAGKKKLLASTGSINSLLKYVQKNKKKVWQGMDYETLGTILYRAYNKQLVDKDGKWNEAEIRQLLKSLKKTSSVNSKNIYISDSNWFQGGCYNAYSNNLDSLFFAPIDDTAEWRYLQNINRESEGSYQFTGLFETDSMVGINKNADSTISDEFIQLLYGEDAQNSMINSNIPLRCSSLEDHEDFQKMLYKVKTHINYNKSQSNAMQQALELYMSGNRSLDDTVKRIMSNKTYVKSYASLALDASKELNILFIGNSRTRVCDIPGQFAKMAKLNGKKIKVNTCLYDGESLDQIISGLTKENKEQLKNADVIIFQEYGGKQDTTTLDVKKLMGMASKNAKFLFYLTDSDTWQYNLVERRLGQIDNLSFIPAGHVHDLLIDKKMYTYVDLHQPNDFHQNLLYAFVIAQTMYATLFDQDLGKIKYNDFSSYIGFYLKGKTNQEKQVEVEKIQGVIKEVFAKK